MDGFFREWADDLLPHIEDSIRSGEFEMFGMRDEAEVAEFNAQLDASVREQIQEAWDELQTVPSYVESQAARFATEE